MKYLFEKYKDRAIMLLAMVLPIFVILVYPIYFQPDDMQDFIRWSKAWESNWQRIYIDCTGCAYPFLGTFFSAGVISFIDFEKVRYVVRVFHIYLALIDALNVVLIYFILKKLAVKHPPFWAGVIGLLPSSWIGTSYWGQIDGIGQSLILLMILNTINFNFNQDQGRKQYQQFLFISGILLACLLLTKQLVLFSLLSLGGMLLSNIILYSRKLSKILLPIIVLILSFVIPIVMIDLILEIPTQYVSHVQHILEIGSRIGDVVSSYGFNAWIFFYDDTLVSSHTSLFTLNLFPSLEISPFTIGIFLFLLSNLIFLIPIAKHFYKRYKSERYFFEKQEILLWLFQLSFLNLSLNIFLTGTHERYLYHFYPFILIAFLGLPFLNYKVLYLLLAGAVLYGAFLYGYLSALNMLFDRLPFYTMAIFHAGLLIFMTIFLNKYFLVPIQKRENDVTS